MKFGAFAIVGRNTKRIEKIFSRHFQPERKKPDFVVTYGGDGTILHSERAYPEIPKLSVRHWRKCAKCLTKKTKAIHKATEKIYCENALEKIISKLEAGKFKIKEHGKIEGTAFTRKNGKRKKTTLVGLNEIQIHNSNHIHAVRFDFCSNGVCLKEEVVGDGIVASTAYGSTAYFYAIAHKKFKEGFGIAFNNTIARHEPVFLKKKFEITVHIHRRNALLISDNDPKMVALREGDKVLIKPAEGKARTIGV
jgi:NAD+ kinase